MGAQQYQCTGFHGLNAIFMGQFFQLFIFGSGIEYDPFRMKGKNILIIFLLMHGIQVEGDGINTFDGNLIFDHCHIGNGSFPAANSYHRMPMLPKAIYGQITVPGWV